MLVLKEKGSGSRSSCVEGQPAREGDTLSLATSQPIPSCFDEKALYIKTNCIPDDDGMCTEDQGDGLIQNITYSNI